MKNNIYFVFNTLFSSVKAQETDRDYRDYWISVPLMVISTKKREQFPLFYKNTFSPRTTTKLKKTEAYGFTLLFHVWNCQGWIQKGWHFSAATGAWEGQGAPLLVSALDSGSAVSMGRALLLQVALDLTATLLTFTDKWKEKKQREICVPNKSVVPQVHHCKNRNAAEHYAFKSIALTSDLNKHK